MPDFTYTDLLPTGEDQTSYRLLTADGVSTASALGRTFLQVEPEPLRLLADTAIRDISHLLRPTHLQQLRRILDDDEASANDKFVALDLLKNASIAAGGVLPMCQDTGTAIVSGKRGSSVLTDDRDAEHLSRGIFDAYTRLNLRYSQLAPLTMWEEKNTGSNLPAQIELYAKGGSAYDFLFMAKGGGSANKSFLFQETKAVLNPAGMMRFLREKVGALGTAACPPYHLAIVVGGTSAEFALKTAKLASAHDLDGLPTGGSLSAHGFRDLDLEAEVFAMTQQLGIGAQFGGKYFCHDVRAVRLPRHGASCPVAIAVSCSADRQARGRIDASGVWLEQLETDPAQYLPEETGLTEDVVQIDLAQPMAQIRAKLSQPSWRSTTRATTSSPAPGHRPRPTPDRPPSRSAHVPRPSPRDLPRGQRAAWTAGSTDASCSSGTARAHNQPWAERQPRAASARACSGVSTPSAVVDSPVASASFRTTSVKAVPSPSPWISPTKLLSIFRMSTGMRLT